MVFSRCSIVIGAVLVGALAALPGCAGGPEAPSPAEDEAQQLRLGIFDDLPERAENFVPVVLEADLSGLNETERTVLEHLIDASRSIDTIFLRQANRENSRYREALARLPGEKGTAALRLFDLHYGVYERHRNWSAFVTGVPPRPPGGGFYPADLDREQWQAFLTQHPDREAELISLTTIIERRGEELVGVPYSEAFASELSLATAKLRQAAQITNNRSLQDYLVLLAAALEEDQYQRADMAWMDVESPIELTLGPYEVYEDELFGYKASFESFVTVVDPAASSQLEKLKRLLPEMERHLPIADEHKNFTRGQESPVRVANLVFSAGEARAGIQTAAFNLPNDEMVRELKGSKKVLLSNVIAAKFDKALVPIAARVLVEEQASLIDGVHFRDLVLLHEMSHGLGPGIITVDGQTAQVREFLLETYPTIEEAKADICGLWNLLWLGEKKAMPVRREELFATYLAGLFRSTRFGTGSAHGKGAAIQFHLLVAKGAVRFDPATGRVGFQAAVFEKAVREIAAELLLIEATGDYAAAQQLIETKGAAPPPMHELLSRLGDIPTDLKPIFPVAGEQSAP